LRDRDGRENKEDKREGTWGLLPPASRGGVVIGPDVIGTRLFKFYTFFALHHLIISVYIFTVVKNLALNKNALSRFDFIVETARNLVS